MRDPGARPTVAAVPAARKLREYARRYLPGELAATIGGIAGALLARRSGAGIAAVAATWGGTVAFYGFVTARELRGSRPLAAVRSVVAEYWLAEACDSLFLRPLVLYACTAALDSVLAGVVVGRLCADVAFYALAIPAYELRRRRLALRAT
jgi:hypothetical protein